MLFKNIHKTKFEFLKFFVSCCFSCWKYAKEYQISNTRSLRIELSSGVWNFVQEYLPWFAKIKMSPSILWRSWDKKCPKCTKSVWWRGCRKIMLIFNRLDEIVIWWPFCLDDMRCENILIYLYRYLLYIYLFIFICYIFVIVLFLFRCI